MRTRKPGLRGFTQVAQGRAARREKSGDLTLGQQAFQGSHPQHLLVLMLGSRRPLSHPAQHCTMGLSPQSRTDPDSTSESLNKEPGSDIPGHEAPF